MFKRKELFEAMDSLISENIRRGITSIRLAELFKERYGALFRQAQADLAMEELQDVARTRLKRLDIRKDERLEISLEGMEEFFMPLAIPIPSEDDGPPIWRAVLEVNMDEHAANMEMLGTQVAATVANFEQRKQLLSFHKRWDKKFPGITLGDALKKADAIVMQEAE